MFMLSAYLDETGRSEDPKQRYVGIAGLMAPAHHWEQFEGKWKAALRLPHFNFPFFHMTDFAARRSHYQGWNDKRREKVLGKIYRIIESTCALPFGSILLMDDYRSLPKEDQELLGQPYYLCFQSVVAASTTFLEAKNYPADEKIALIFSDQTEFRYTALLMYEAIKAAGLYQHRCHAPIFQEMREIVALQAADIIAYEMYKEVDRKLHAPTRAVRWPYTRIQEMTRKSNFREPMFRIIDKAEMNRTLYMLKEYNKAKELKRRIGGRESKGGTQNS